LYIDDGELQVRNFQAAEQPSSTSPTCDARLSAAKAAGFRSCCLYPNLFGLYSWSKNVCLSSTKKNRYLSFVSDTDLEAFYLSDDKQKKFLELVNSILSGNTVSVHTLQRHVGKCFWFRLAVQDSRLFTNEINLAIGKGLKFSKPVRVSPSLKDEIQHWADPSVVARVGKWRSERHHQFVVYSDASSFAWEGVFVQESLIPISDYCSASLVDLDINVKETRALSNILLSFGDKLQDARVDAYVDNQALVQALQSQAARSSCFSDDLKE